MKIDIICPLYNGRGYVEKLHKSLLEQEKIELHTIQYIVTDTKDGTQEVLKNLNATYRVIKKIDFSHSLTREETAMTSTGDIIVFITQDVIIQDKMWLYHLVEGIISGECDASYSRQICKLENIEKYTREKNYPEYSYVKDKSTIEKYGLHSFFYSDTASAIKSETYRALNGYDGKKLPTNEDMYIAYKLIMGGYRIKYCSDSVVVHNHDFTLKEVYKRYKLYGEFFKEESYLNNYGANGQGLSLMLYIVKRALQDKNIKVLFRLVPNMAARFIGMKIGKK